jgi:copper oxidase (laccase) domain-containing protein
MHERFGSRPESLLAVMGPSAGPCCYEIGHDVAGRLDSGSVVVRGGRLFGDLRKEVLLRLVSAGVRRESVESAGECTVCHADDYYSHRRDGKNSGRMAGYIMIG